MKKRLLSILMCLALLVGVLPMGLFSLSAAAAEVDTAETGEDYTDPAHPYVANSYADLKAFVNKNRFSVFDLDNNKEAYSSYTYYVKLGANVSYSGAELETLRTNGANIVLDLAGYTLSYEDKSNFGNCALAGTYGTLTINDSRRYDSSAGKYVDGKIDYVYVHPYKDRNTAAMCGNIVVNGGTIVNRTKSDADHSAYANLFYAGTRYGNASGSLQMYGGVLEAERPIFIGISKSVAIFNGELRVKKDVGVMMYYRNDDSVSAEYLPTIYRCRITNASGKEKVLAFTIQFPTGTSSSHAFSCFDSIFSEGSYAFVDDAVQPSFRTGATYSAGILFSPMFYESYVVSPCTILNELDAIISEPAPGNPISYDAYVPNGVNYQVMNLTSGNLKYGVRWSQIEGSTRTYLTPGSSTVFEAGKIYAVEIVLETTSKYLYRFADADKITAAINNRKAVAWTEGGGTCVLERQFLCPNKTPVTSLDLTIPQPYLGEQPAFSASAPSGAAYTVNTDYSPHSYWKNGVEWGWAYLANDPGYVFTGISPAATSARFESGKAYQITICVTLTDANKYTFGENMTATVNGKQAKIIKVNNTTYTVSCIYKMPYRITSVDLTIPEPTAGKKLNYAASVPSGANYKVEKNNASVADGWYRGVRWLDGNTIIPYTGKDTFEEGKRYTVVISLVPKDDLHYFGRVSQTTATINGQPAKIDNFGDGSIGISYTFVLPKEIDTLSVTIPQPQADESMSYEAFVPFGEGYAVSDFTGGAWRNGVMWEDEYGAYTPDYGYFEQGETYSVLILLTITDEELFSFAPGMSMEAYVNGGRADEDKQDDATYMVRYSFTVTGDPAGDYIIGDADKDGKISILDATAIQRKLASLSVKSFDEKAADADVDTKVTILDATAIQRHLASLSTNPNIGKQA